jgi:hypothetical protein
MILPFNEDKAAAEFRQFVESKKPKQTTQTTQMDKETKP